MRTEKFKRSGLISAELELPVRFIEGDRDYILFEQDGGSTDPVQLVEDKLGRRGVQIKAAGTAHQHGFATFFNRYSSGAEVLVGPACRAYSRENAEELLTSLLIGLDTLDTNYIICPKAAVLSKDTAHAVTRPTHIAKQILDWVMTVDELKPA